MTPSVAPAPRSRVAGRVPLPRVWPVAAGDIVWVLAGNVVLIAAMWVRHGGLDQLNTLGGILTAIGQLTGLFGAYLALLQLVLMSRSPWLDQVFGMDRLAWAHRWLGFATLWLIVAHGVFIVTGYSFGDRQSVLVGLPDISGLEVARRVRKAGGEMAILMLTARDTRCERGRAGRHRLTVRVLTEGPKPEDGAG